MKTRAELTRGTDVIITFIIVVSLYTSLYCSPCFPDLQIKAPCCFVLGTGDHRVDKSPGLRLCKHLKARGVEVHYDIVMDNHQMSAELHRADVLIRTLRWFYRFGLS
ncbi:acylamino-acid-releasing enzyme-like [Tropilaelaps mercedesae]|uniref:Acylamino-acid-releasing enzyme-like n=1 Tax=Tropilaelaps mercedesae TaxID=418985 RepID=A0A1V9XHK7_9ACAR|nr:acylamino-acid-releasing enzyme-like [Tropilaelaps mercedesae]